MRISARRDRADRYEPGLNRAQRYGAIMFPAHPYEVVTFKRCKVNIDYHIELKAGFYSVSSAGAARQCGHQSVTKVEAQAVFGLLRGSREVQIAMQVVRPYVKTDCAQPRFGKLLDFSGPA